MTRSRTGVLKVNARTRYESHLDSLYGPAPLNPFTRLRNSLELSHEELARQMYTSKQSLIRLEQGCYDKPLPVAVDWWVNYGAVTELQITDAYEEFQQLTRTRHHQYFGPELQIDYTSVIADHPLRQLCNSHPYFPVNVTEVAKSLCLPQATLQHWQKKWRTQQSVPRTFQSVLMEIGYSKYQVKDFNEAYYNWRQTQLSRSKIRLGA